MTLLRHFLRDAIFPRRLADVSAGTRRKYESVAARFGDFLGHDALLVDLSGENLAAFRDWLTAQGMRPDRVGLHQTVLRTIAADARAVGEKTGPMTATQRERRQQKLRRDLRGPKAKIKRRIVKAAALFANGCALAEIAKRLEVTEHAVHNWRGRYRAFWDAAYGEAIARSLTIVKRKEGENAKLVGDQAFFQKANRAEAALRVQGQTLIQPSDTAAASAKTLAEFLQDMAVERAWEESTKTHYRCVVRRVEKWYGHTLHVTQFSREWMNRFLADLEASGLASATVRGSKVHLLAIWRAACEAGLCYEEPKRLRKIKLRLPPPEAWSREEVRALLARAGQLSGRYGLEGETSIARSLFWTLAIRVLWETGLRSNDALSLRRRDVRADGVATIVQHKTERVHVVRVSPATLALLWKRADNDERVLPWRASREFLRREFAVRILKPLGMRGSLKKLRKSSGTNVELQQLGAGARQLGHAPGSKIAAMHYLDPSLIGANWPMPQPLDDGANEPPEKKGGAA